MHSLWSDVEAERLVDRYAAVGVGRDLALRVYTSRLLGGEPKLVLHGGGNTSVKTILKDVLGEEVEVLCVKGSGWDMAAIEPAGLPAVRLAPLRKLRGREALSDEEMVRVQRANLFDRRGRGSRADPARRLRNRRSGGFGFLQALHPRFSFEHCGTQLCERGRSRALRPRWRGNPGSYDPHEELPADRTGPRNGSARC